MKSEVLGNGAPSYYDHINSHVSLVNPSTMHVEGTGLNRFFERYLLQKAISVFEWKLPESWVRDYFLYVLYCWGFIAIVNTDKFGIIPQGCSLRGYNVMYQPTHALITNPLLSGIKECQIDKDCTLIRLTPDYGGIMDLVSFYANMMAVSAQTASSNLVNSKLAYVFGAKNKAQAESFKKMFDKIASGEPAVWIDKELFNEDGSANWQTFEQNLSQNYIAGNILEDLKKWENMFLTEIGIPNSNTEKKERMIVDEVNANNGETKALAELWLEELKKGCEKTRAMFGIDISVDFRKSLQKPEIEQMRGDDSNEE